MSPKKLKCDEIGFWSEIKLDIIKKYADAYSRIMSSPSQQKFQLKHIYISRNIISLIWMRQRLVSWKRWRENAVTSESITAIAIKSC